MSVCPHKGFRIEADIIEPEGEIRDFRAVVRFTCADCGERFAVLADDSDRPRDRYLMLRPCSEIPRPPAVLHISGPMVDLVQACSRCGAVLCDYRNASWPVDQGPPTGFAEGKLISVRTEGWLTEFMPADGTEPDDAVPCAAQTPEASR